IVLSFVIYVCVLVRLGGDRVGTFDVRPASHFRRNRIDRDVSDLNRTVGPGLTYRDEGAKDVLALKPGAAYTTPWSSGAVDVAELSFQNLRARPARVEISSGDTTKVVTVPPVARIDSIFQDREYRRLGPITVRAVDRVDLLRVEGFEPLPALAGPDGPFIVTPGRLCRSG